LNRHRAALERFFFLDSQAEWLIRGPDHPSLNRRTEHVEVKRLRTAGGAVYSKRFLKRQGGIDYSYWSEREVRFVGHFGGARTPQVVRPALLQFQADAVERVDTQDAGPSLDNWQKLRVSRAGNPGAFSGVFDDAGELALLLRACLQALHGLHALGIVHCDIKADNLCLAYAGEPLGETGIQLDYRKLRVIDFAFSVWPGVPGWDLEQCLPIAPDSPQADYLSPWFKQSLREDRRQHPPQAWRGLDYGVDLYALGCMLHKLLAARRRTLSNPEDPLAAFLHTLAEEWTQRYAQAAPAGKLPHAQDIQRIEARLSQHRPDWTPQDWACSRRFLPREVWRLPPEAMTPLASAVPADVPPTPLFEEADNTRPARSWRVPSLAALALAATVAGAYFGLGRAPSPAVSSLADSLAPSAAACPAPSLDLLPQATSPALASPPTALAYSPDSATLAAGEENGSVLLWQAASLRRFNASHQGSVKTLAFSPDGQMLVSGGSDKTLRRWSVAEGSPLGAALTGHGDKVVAVAFAADGSAFASIGSDGSLRRWSAAGQPLGQPLQGKPLSAAAFGPGLANFATGKALGEVGLWDGVSGQSIGEPRPGHDSAVNVLAFSPDGSLLVSGGWDKGLRRWNVRTGAPLGQPLEQHPQSLTALAFAPDGQRFASADLDGHLRLWDTRTGCLLAQAQHPQGVTALAFTPDGLRLASAGYDRTLRAWRLEAARP